MLLKNTKTMVRYEIEGVKEVLEFNGGGVIVTMWG